MIEFDENEKRAANMSDNNVVEFPGAEPVEIEWTQSMIDEVHGRAFRDLEKGIGECETMSMIALQLAERAIIEGPRREFTAAVRAKADDQAMFAVFHLADMLTKLKADYERAFYAEKVQS
jgi:hypothetical protein